MTVHLGFYNTSGTRTFVRLLYPTFASAGGNVAPLSAIDAADIRIYKAADSAAFSATQRSSSNGITSTSPFDSLTGFHEVDIDLTDNTDAGFYASGAFYSVVFAPDNETIDGQTITGAVLGYFEIGVNPVNAIQISGDATAADNLETAFDDAAGAVPWTGIIDQGTAQSATSTTLVLRSAAAFANDEIIGATIVITGGTGIGQSRVITDYVSSTDTATVDAWTTTPSGTITYKIFGSAPASTASPAAVNVTQWLGTAASTPTVAGVPNVNVKTWNDLTTVALPLIPTTAGRTLTIGTDGAADANVQKMNDATVQGTGTEGDLWRG